MVADVPVSAAPVLVEPGTKRFPVLPVVTVVNNLLAHQHPVAPVIALPAPVATPGTTSHQAALPANPPGGRTARRCAAESVRARP